MTPKMLSRLVTALLLIGFLYSSLGQSNEFRSSHAHIGVGAGLFTYHGPISFINTNRIDNQVNHSSLGVTLTGSFPIVPNKAYFRGVLGGANFNPDRGLFEANDNEFGYHRLGWFDAQVVFPIFRGYDRVMPYVFGGVGALVADPFRTNQDDNNIPDEGRVGPDRTVISLPVVGAGVDVALTKGVSFYVEGTYRFHWDFFIKSPNNPFDTSFLTGGLRFALPSRHAVVDPPPVYIEPQDDIPVYVPPAPVKQPCAYNPNLYEDDPNCVPPRPPTTCDLYELNIATFGYGSSSLDAQAMALLEENIQELLHNPDCCVKIVGYTDEASSDAQAIRVSEQRAQAVYNYYVQRGISPERLRMMGMGIALPNCNKSDPGRGCRYNRRVESIPMKCDDYRFR